jgi:hypothetical protein
MGKFTMAWIGAICVMGAATMGLLVSLRGTPGPGSDGLSWVQNGQPVEAEPNTIDMGVIPEGQIIPLQYVLHNQSKDIIQITRVKADCGCVVPRLDQSSIEPGGAITLNATFDRSEEHTSELQSL